MMKYGRLISSESFVYLEKPSVLAKHRQLLMPALIKMCTVHHRCLRSSATKKHFVRRNSKSDLTMILFQASKKSDFHWITFLVPFSSSFPALSSFLDSCTTRLFKSVLPRVRGCEKFTPAPSDVSIAFSFTLFPFLL